MSVLKISLKNDDSEKSINNNMSLKIKLIKVVIQEIEKKINKIWAFLWSVVLTANAQAVQGESYSYIRSVAVGAS